MGLMRQADIGRHWKISRQAVHKLIKNAKKNGFPAPVRPGVWDVAEVDEWRQKKLSHSS